MNIYRLYIVILLLSIISVSVSCSKIKNNYITLPSYKILGKSFSDKLEPFEQYKSVTSITPKEIHIAFNSDGTISQIMVIYHKQASFNELSDVVDSVYGGPGKKTVDSQSIKVWRIVDKKLAIELVNDTEPHLLFLHFREGANK